MKKFVVIGTASVVPEDVIRMEFNEGKNLYNKEFKGINISVEKVVDGKYSEETVFSEGIQLQEATKIINDHFEAKAKEKNQLVLDVKVDTKEIDKIMDNWFGMMDKMDPPTPEKPFDLKDFFGFLESIGISNDGSFNLADEVPGSKPETVEDYLKTDPVTMAVDKCNAIFASNSLTVGLFVDRVGTPEEETNVPYGRRNGKLYTAATLKKVEEIEARVTPEEVTDDELFEEEVDFHDIKGHMIASHYKCQNPKLSVEFAGYNVKFFDPIVDRGFDVDIIVYESEQELISKIEKTFNCTFLPF